MPLMKSIGQHILDIDFAHIWCAMSALPISGAWVWVIRPIPSLDSFPAVLLVFACLSNLHISYQ